MADLEDELPGALRLAGERSWREVAGIQSDETAEIEDATEDSRFRSRDRADRIVNRLDER